MDGGTTVGTGINTKVFIGGQLAAVAGDLSSHNMLGALISTGLSKVNIAGVPAIAALIDNAAPDAIGNILHPEGLPTPATGSQKVNIGPGSFAGGLGSFGLGGMPNVGELLSFAGNIVGQVKRTNNTGGNSGMMVMDRAPAAPNAQQPGAGDTVTGQNTGRTFTFSNYFS